MGSVLFSMLSLFMMVKPCFGDADLEVARAGDMERGRSEQSASRTGSHRTFSLSAPSPWAAPTCGRVR